MILLKNATWWGGETNRGILSYQWFHVFLLFLLKMIPSRNEIQGNLICRERAMVCGVIENRASVINHPTVDRKRERDKKIELDTAKACPQWETRYCCSPWRGWIGCWDVSCLITFSALPEIFMLLLRVMKLLVHVKMSLSFSHYMC